MSIHVQVSNLGPLRFADQKISQLTLFVGENNSGKTFLATVCHRVLNTSQRLRWPRRLRGERPPKTIVNWLKHLASLSDDQVIPGIEIDKETRRWAQAFAGATLESFGHAVRDDLEYAYGMEANDLRRRTASRRATDCYLRICSTSPIWSIQVRFDRGVVEIDNIDVDQWLRDAFDPKKARKLYARYIEDYPIGFLTEDDVVQLSSGFYRELQRTLFRDWPRNAIHLPAGRTGVMHSHELLASNIVQLSSEAGLRPIEIDPLHGTTADYLALLVRPERRPFRRRLPRELARVIHQLETEMRAEIVFETDVGSRRRIVIRTPEGEFPLSITSSMISELAPLILVMKYSVSAGYHLTIDEPESHLHPYMQRLMARCLVSLVNHGIGTIITTHSDYLVSEIANAIRSHSLGQRQGRAVGIATSGIDATNVAATRFERRGNSCITWPMQIDNVDGIDQSTFSEVMEAQYEDSASLVEKMLERPRRKQRSNDTRFE